MRLLRLKGAVKPFIARRRPSRMPTPGPFAIPPLTRFRRHRHESGHICVVLDGGFLEKDKTSWRDVGRGTVRVSGAARHDIDFSASGAVCLVMEVESDELENLETPRFFEKDSRLSALADAIANPSERTDAART